MFLLFKVELENQKQAHFLIFLILQKKKRNILTKILENLLNHKKSLSKSRCKQCLILQLCPLEVMKELL